eukprot:gnl/MRDRNA2_/MRDRNA2_143821_c0_seq1.p1 gnl/MRDRNA2_/MRDRNA2_143821_c0~~gnl/MRDRNA2_/MRDRNA2_143821_c0_seq1.p1  ORF type:complete len:409 (+),score=42.62 gnl/MRDRNA2_/MRDRNA2_143821_c0_seq1:110-1336(+)
MDNRQNDHQKEKDIAFTYRKLQAWQPALSPMTTVATIMGIGALLLSLGISILVAGHGSVEVSHDYTEDGMHHGSHNAGWFQVTIPKDMEPPIIVQYEIHGMSQGNQHYLKSRSEAQLRGEGEPMLRPDHEELRPCHPRISQNDKVLYPCGLVARSVFTDTFVLRASKSGASKATQMLELDESLDALVPGGLGYRQLNPESVVDGRSLHTQLHMWLTSIFPPTSCEQVDFSVTFEPIDVAWRTEAAHEGEIQVVDCREYSSGFPRCNFLKSGQPFNCSGTHREVQRPEWGVESGHFAAWMQTGSAGGTVGVVRKPWAVIRQALPAGTVVNVSFVDRYPVHSFLGRKLLVLSTESWTGSSNPGAEILLGWGHVGLGVCATLLGLWYLIAVWNHGQDLVATNFLDRIPSGR